MYNASKAALAAASETWRIELGPLGVRVIALITLGVKTNGFDGKVPHEIPQNSNYWHIRDFIDGLNDGRLQTSGITTKEYAAKVYREVEGGTVGMTWVGGSAGIARFSWWLLPRSLRVSILSFSQLRCQKLTGIQRHACGKYHSFQEGDGQGLAKEKGLNNKAKAVLLGVVND